MFKFGQKSLDRLKGVHPDLVKVVTRALELSSVDFSVSEGLRTKERQQELYKQGKSKTLNSRHITGHAVDIYPVSNTDGKWTPEDFKPIVNAMKQAAKELNTHVVHGADWGWDSPHHELNRALYP